MPPCAVWVVQALTVAVKGPAAAGSLHRAATVRAEVLMVRHRGGTGNVRATAGSPFTPGRQAGPGGRLWGYY